MPDFVTLLLRWSHILGAFLIGGGLLTAWLAVAPAKQQLSGQAQEAFSRIWRSRWSKLVAVGTLLLLASGLTNFVITVQQYEIESRYYHPVFGVKFLIALAVFFLAAILPGKTALAQRMRAKESLWLAIASLMVLVIIVLSGTLRYAEKVPKKESAAGGAAPASALSARDYQIERHGASRRYAGLTRAQTPCRRYHGLTDG